MIIRILLRYLPFCYGLPFLSIFLFEMNTSVKEEGDWVSKGLLERNGISLESILFSPIYFTVCSILFIVSLYFFEFRKKN